MITRMITCWKLILLNDKQLFFTDSDQNVSFENEEYIAGSYFTPNSIINSNELAQDNFAISGIIDANFFSKEKLLSGEFDNATLEVFLIDLQKNPLEKIILKTGWIGEIKLTNNNFVIEVNSLSSKTRNLVGKCYSISCRAEFGDQFCKKNIDDYTFFGKVGVVLENNTFIDEERIEPDEYFNRGVLIFISGEYKNRKFQVLSFNKKTIQLEYYNNLKLQIGDNYKIIAGCNKSLEACISMFNNAINFRGEPFIPGRHKLLASN